MTSMEHDLSQLGLGPDTSWFHEYREDGKRDDCPFLRLKHERWATYRSIL